MSSALRALPMAIAIGALVATAQSATAGELSVSLSPDYVEGLTGSNGWYTVAVTATYVCDPSGSEIVASCPPTEVFRDGTGVVPDGGTGEDGEDGDRASGDIVRTATFLRSRGRTRTASVRLGVGDLPLRVDTQPPPAPVITGPATGALSAPVLPGTALTATYSCSFDGDASGPAEEDACVGTVPSGARLDTGRPGNRNSWGARALTVTATDAAGHTAQTTVSYRIADAGAAAPLAPSAGGNGNTVARAPRTTNARIMRPGAGTAVRGSTVLRWRAIRGAALYNVQVFRVAGDGYVKVLSAFPRRNRLSVRAAGLAPGERFVWRVWPFMRRTGDYRRTPVGISWFQTPAA